MTVQASTRAIIDLSAFRNNLEVVRGLIGPGIRIMAVLKSNAYGHGVRSIAHEAVRWGVEYLAVARLGEGLELRAEGIGTPILVCEIIPDDQVEQALHDDLELTVTSVEGGRHIALVAQRMGRRARVHIKVDTGMGRLGFPYRDAADSVEQVAGLAGLEIMGVFSHFANSEEPGQQFARLQLLKFQEVLADLDRRHVEIPFRHMANSGAIAAIPESHFTMVRPGLMLYGYTPAPGMRGESRLRPMMSLVSRVSFVKRVAPGTSISYSQRYFTTAETRIATVPIGYGDGYSRTLTNKAEVLINGRRYRTVGAICMDHLMVDVGMDGSVREGDTVTLIGRDGEESITCWDIARQMGTVPYEVTCLITPRVQRVFVE